MVLIGKDTWKRKHVDWEIAASLRETKYNKRSGVIGILLPTHKDYNASSYIWGEDLNNNVDIHTIPPRLTDNLNNGFVKIYNWREDSNKVAGWVDEAFRRRNSIIPNNSRDLFGHNREQWRSSWSD